MRVNFEETVAGGGPDIMIPNENGSEVLTAEPEEAPVWAPEFPGRPWEQQAGESISVWCARDPDEDEEDEDDVDYFADDEDEDEDELDEDEDFDEEEFEDEEDEEEDVDEEDF